MLTYLFICSIQASQCIMYETGKVKEGRKEVVEGRKKGKKEGLLVVLKQ